MVVGLGAFGRDYEECRGRFGELLAAGGAAAYLPTDGTNHPDYLLSAGAFVPTPQLLYGLACEGSFQRVLRFDADLAGGPASLGSVVRGCLDGQDAEAVGIVMVAESRRAHRRQAAQIAGWRTAAMRLAGGARVAVVQPRARARTRGCSAGRRGCEVSLPRSIRSFGPSTPRAP